MIYLQENASINKYTGIIIEIIDDKAKEVENYHRTDPRPL